MTGVSCQCRFSKGSFNLKSAPKRYGKENNGFYSNDHVFTILLSLAGAVPLKILFGLITVFAYSLMFVLLLIISLLLYLYIKCFL